MIKTFELYYHPNMVDQDGFSMPSIGEKVQEILNTGLYEYVDLKYTPNSYSGGSETAILICKVIQNEKTKD